MIDEKLIRMASLIRREFDELELVLARIEEGWQLRTVQMMIIIWTVLP